MFDNCWKFVTRYGDVVQNKDELLHTYQLMMGCKSYLEVGTAEGSSLYVLAHALDKDATITYVDYGEDHTTKSRNEVLSALYAELGVTINQYHGNSHHKGCIKGARSHADYDVVLIDAGHTFPDVVADAMAYGCMARKYLFFHDIQLPAVKAAFDWYCDVQKFQKVSTFIRSDNYGFGVVDLT